MTSTDPVEAAGAVKRAAALLREVRSLQRWADKIEPLPAPSQPKLGFCVAGARGSRRVNPLLDECRRHRQPALAR